MSAARKLTGVAAERARIKAIVHRIMREIYNKPTDSERHIPSGEFIGRQTLASFRNLDPIGLVRRKESDWFLFPPDECTPQLVWPVDCGLILTSDTSDQLRFGHCETVNPRLVRGSVHRFSPFMCCFRMGYVHRNELQTSGGVYVWLNGAWSPADKRRLKGAYGRLIVDTGAAPEPALYLSLQLRHRYEWAVSIGYKETPSIRFATDPTGIKEIFKLRDVPEGKDRRAALATWITNHWRQDRRDNDIEIYVRKHIRGRVSFDWDGLQCEIIPSQFDLDKRDQLIAEREAMRIAGTDRRDRQAKS